MTANLKRRREVSWDDAVRALLEYRIVWDDSGTEWKRIGNFFRWGPALRDGYFEAVTGKLFLDPPVIGDPYNRGVARRTMKREDAVCLMVRDELARCWDGEGTCYAYSHEQVMVFDDMISSWCPFGGHLPNEVYVDPPEAK